MTYPGGKGHVYQKIINQIPPHRAYIEPFVGGGAVLLNKRPAIVNIAIDADAEAIRRLSIWAAAIATNGDDSGIIARNNDGASWQFIVGDALTWLDQYPFCGDEFIYADPPYLLHTRRQARQIYRYELCEPADHRRLLDILAGLPCKIMISGYWSEMYARRLAGWRSISFEAQTRSGSTATEYLWMNYPEPTALHDYRYLGDNYRERERIKRKKLRWLSRLQKMDHLERLAISAAIAEMSDA